MTRILVTGSRHGWPYGELRDVLDDILREWGVNPPPVLVHGAAPGVDSQAAAIWKSWGLPVEAHPADWETLGKKAGPIRNEEMVKSGADACVAFLDTNSKGTADCIRRAKRDGIPVAVYKRTPDYARNTETVPGQLSFFSDPTKEK